MRTTLAGLVALLVLLVAAGGARASGGVEISQQLFDGDGNPLLVANAVPDGSAAKPSWAVCPPGGACAPAGVTDQSFEPGPAAAGTTFEASATSGGTTYAARTDPWLGVVAATAPPTLTGTPRVGARVTPHAGSWTGGWGGESDLLHVEACRTARGRGCTVIAHPWAPRSMRRRIDPRWSGRYLFAFDERFARDTVLPDILYGSPEAIPRSIAGATIARSVPLGPVRGPKLRLRRHPLLRRDDRLLVGRATCPHGCRVGVTVHAGKLTRRARLRVRGTRDLAVPGAAGLPLERALAVRVRIGRAPLVHVAIEAHQVVAAGAPRRG